MLSERTPPLDPSSRAIFDALTKFYSQVSLMRSINLPPETPLSPREVSIPPVDDVSRDFHTQAIKGKGLLVSTCTLPSSGCMGFGMTLSSAYPNLDHVRVVVDCMFGHYKAEVVSAKPQSYETLFVTGCAPDHTAKILDTLSSKYDFTHLSHIYIVSAPHLSSQYHDGYTTLINQIKSQLTYTPLPLSHYDIHVINTGINPTYAIGMPEPFPIVAESKKSMSDTVFGLMYLRSSGLDYYSDYAYLDTYFSQVAIAAKKKGASTANVIVIKNKELSMSTFNKMASKHGISIIYEDPMPQADFIKTMQHVVKQGGIMSFDGVYSLIQANYMAGQVLVHIDPIRQQFNIPYYKKLTDMLPLDLQAVGKVILGLNKEYALLKKRNLCERVFKVLHQIVMTSITQFEHDKRKYVVAADLATTTPTVSSTPESTPSPEKTCKPAAMETSTALHQSSPPTSAYIRGNLFGKKRKAESIDNLPAPAVKKGNLLKCVIS